MDNVLSTGNSIVGSVNQPLTLSNIIFKIHQMVLTIPAFWTILIISLFKESFLKENFGCIVLSKQRLNNNKNTENIVAKKQSLLVKVFGQS